LVREKNPNWRARLQHAFAVDDKAILMTAEDEALIDRLVKIIVDRGLTAPATAALEASRPYTFLGSQFMAFAKPFAQLVLPGRDYQRFTEIMEKRSSIDLILDRLEKTERDA
jgi:hypothetical protein